MTDALIIEGPWLMPTPTAVDLSRLRRDTADLLEQILEAPGLVAERGKPWLHAAMDGLQGELGRAIDLHAEERRVNTAAWDSLHQALLGLAASTVDAEWRWYAVAMALSELVAREMRLLRTGMPPEPTGGRAA